MWAPVVAGLVMYLVVTACRPALTGAASFHRFGVLVGVGAVTYLAIVFILDQRVWRDIKRTSSALKD
jgi:hypothetical protein